VKVAVRTGTISQIGMPRRFTTKCHCDISRDPKFPKIVGASVAEISNFTFVRFCFRELDLT
jgi:hypothetical protein